MDKKSLIMGAAAGVVLMVIIYLIFFLGVTRGEGVCSATAISNACKSAGNEETSFVHADSYKTIKADFAGGTIPIYDPTYCEKKFKERYGKDAVLCVVKDVTTVARENPFVTDISCTCWS